MNKIYKLINLLGENHVNMFCLQNMDEKRPKKVHVHEEYILGKIIPISCTRTMSYLTLP